MYTFRVFGQENTLYFPCFLKHGMAFSVFQNTVYFPVQKHRKYNDDSNDSYKEILIECNNEESLEYSNNEETGSKEIESENE
ncbi:23748_t:CDS:2 [Gigaspora margarita]|uniref:23748_t:CDS:1 n=1 Tax=Gigaspora margarita TaxID=4874 RepID=A0ABN7UJ87_GIGMA|nr:23748_t:CDS:2 [Gigaspora margarita]